MNELQKQGTKRVMASSRVPPSTRSTRNLSSIMSKSQNHLPAAYYRGGTSRAVMFKEQDLPSDRSKWKPIFLGILGSPDRYGRQLDGMGGGISSLSKVCVVAPASRMDADVDYTFAAIGVKNTDVDLSSNCGNMSSAIGPFAVDSKLVNVKPEDSVATVRIHNTNTGKIINSIFSILNGEADPYGTYEIDGVEGSAARVQLDFVNPAGSKTGKLLPTGSVVDDFGGTKATCIDVGNPCVFVTAETFDVSAAITPDEIEVHPTLLQRLDNVRRQAGVKMGLAAAPDAVPGSIPKICMVAKSKSKDSDITVRAISVGQPHKAVPITVALSAAAASKLNGSIVQSCVSETMIDPAGVTLAHASGKLTVTATFGINGELEAATVFRTARRLMEGTVYWK